MFQAVILALFLFISISLPPSLSLTLTFSLALRQSFCQCFSVSLCSICFSLFSFSIILSVGHFSLPHSFSYSFIIPSLPLSLIVHYFLSNFLSLPLNLSVSLSLSSYIYMSSYLSLSSSISFQVFLPEPSTKISFLFLSVLKNSSLFEKIHSSCQKMFFFFFHLNELIKTSGNLDQKFKSDSFFLSVNSFLGLLVLFHKKVFSSRHSIHLSKFSSCEVKSQFFFFSEKNVSFTPSRKKFPPFKNFETKFRAGVFFARR